MNQLKKKIPLSTPHFFGNESKSLKECVASGWVTTSGKFIKWWVQIMLELFLVFPSRLLI